MAKERLFIAFDTPEDVREQARLLQDQLRGAHLDASWERPEKIHCTLKFLGDTLPEVESRVISTLTQLCRTVGPFDIAYSGIGCFPNDRNPRILWYGIQDPKGTLQELARGVDSAMAALGYPEETRAFHPHLTLGRVRSPRNTSNLHAILEKITFNVIPASVKEIALVRSELKPSGSVYTIKKVFPLIGNFSISE